MAKVIEPKENKLANKKRNNLILLIMCFLSFGTSIIYFIPILMIIGIFGIPFFLRRYRIISSGDNGEKILMEELSQLSDDYIIFSNLRLVDGKQGETEIDAFVLGKSRIYVLEGKHYNGAIYGHVKDKTLVYEKISKNGNPYHKEIKNPIKQNQWHMRFVKDILERHGISKYLTPVVIFTNPNAEVDLETDSNKVETLYVEELINFIEEDDMGKPLSEKEKNKIIQILTVD